MVLTTLPPFLAALQHGGSDQLRGPRPLPLFLNMLHEQTAASPDRRAVALAGLRAYQQAPRGEPPRRAPVRYRKANARVRDYASRGSNGRVVLFVPSLINPPQILDLMPERSLLRWLAAQGHRPFLLDWGTPTPDRDGPDIAALVERVLLPLIAKFPEPPVLAGYCLGGTMALAAAARTNVAGLALIAAPWRFAGLGSTARSDIARLWEAVGPACATMGLVPMEVLQSGFWRLDPARTIAKYEAFATVPPGTLAFRQFVAMEDWANAGAPLPYNAGRELFEDFIGQDTPGTGHWSVGGAPVDPATIACPTIDFVSRNDRIVPAATAADLPDRRDLGAGHVGMVVGSGARAQLWEPLSDWLNALPDLR
ncbi:alpha/beta fold hydrolase [Sphingomonas sp. PAMC 26621]|uniref:alpha/beta fold hydrolase n=1 Tax=Sphingomonas sp. PAMC 26621 TaxID=1112213 RepID=UPI000288C483|nr:alpha/beta fold hydrolase [Sphingomonas sp. PAMC 26621]